jgi:hypothetical protein
MDVAATLGQFRAQVASLPWITAAAWQARLNREDEQRLIDKVASKLPNWKGRLLNKAGCLTLVNSVLSSTVIYHMSVFKLPKMGAKED